MLMKLCREEILVRCWERVQGFKLWLRFHCVPLNCGLMRPVQLQLQLRCGQAPINLDVVTEIGVGTFICVLFVTMRSAKRLNF